LVIVIFTFAAREVAAQPRACVRADIAETFVLPDGSQHPAGPLRICLDRDYSPVAGLHTIAADGRTSGMFLSRRVKPEVDSPHAPQVAFVRDASGVLCFGATPWLAVAASRPTGWRRRGAGRSPPPHIRRPTPCGCRGGDALEARSSRSGSSATGALLPEGRRPDPISQPTGGPGRTTPSSERNAAARAPFLSTFPVA
jgi:hypothetical protein